MTDRELLEDAAKAAGIDVVRSRLDDPLSRDFLVNASVRNPHQVSGPWNPLTDDGDAFRLMVKLRISVLQPNRPEDRGVIAMWDSGGGVRELTDPNPDAATRRAIVRAAAEIGKGMK